MSKTDVHRPWAVQLADPYNRHLFYRYPAWPWEMALAPIKNFGCGCSMCTNRHQRKRSRRADRHQAQRDLRALSAQWAAGELDEDAPLPRRVEAW
jgi:hypothetical protein